MPLAVSLKLTRFGKLTQRALPTQTPRQVERVAILCHPNPLQEGTMMNKVVTTMYRFARDQNMHVVRFNFRGVGQSTGEYGNVTGEIEDALTVLQWIHSQTEARKLWIGGFSFGGFVAAKLAQLVNEQGAFLGVDDFDITDLALIMPFYRKKRHLRFATAHCTNLYDLWRE
ncbi:MAG: alpha/beta fold hydrolase [Moraxella osloensis]